MGANYNNHKNVLKSENNSVHLQWWSISLDNAFLPTWGFLFYFLQESKYISALVDLIYG